MIKNSYNVIGVMSGTSLDGLDIAHCTFVYTDQWRFTIGAAETRTYPAVWLEKLKHLIGLKRSELELLDEAYTVFMGEAIYKFIQKHELKHLDAICSHGHTALHQPDQGLTYQIGNLSKLASVVKETVVCDFRIDDVALGGQGAPLVPIGDRLLFADYDYCLNLGGFANISTEVNGERIAYDICPVNIVLNHYVSVLGYDYDDGGEIAASGDINQDLLNELNNLAYYKCDPPKSLGLEWVKKTIFPLIDAFKLSTKDVLRTFVEHVVIQIAAEIKTNRKTTVLTTGGGAFNTFMMMRLNAVSCCEIIIPERQIIEYKEALIFAFLGVLKLRNEINCLASVTGASKDHSSGKLYYP